MANNSASADGLSGNCCIALNSQIANFDARAKLRNLPRCEPQRAPHNANMETEKNGGPNYVRQWRERQGLAQKDLAKLIQTSEGNLSDLEQGKRGLNLRWLRRIAEKLEITPGMLVDGPPGTDYEKIRSKVAEPSAINLPPPDILIAVVDEIVGTMGGGRLPASALRPAGEALEQTLRLLSENPANRASLDVARAVARTVAAPPRLTTHEA